ncbi:MAG TPA: asparagine synthase-related protein [Solirubrobacterales bacterium]|nr:asparagine synthase-related protein [Solirubrobacterales bacterium]
MRRPFLGAFDPAGRLAPADLSAALAPEPARAIEAGALRLACGGQAPAAADGLLCLFDGNLDNASQLGAELDAPAAATPEGLVARAYRRWGREAVGRLRGDFALLVWDAERQEGLIARDQLGLRPLFLWRHDGAVAFAGELGNLLALLPRRPAPDPEGVAYWLTAEGRPGAGTLYEGVTRLLPGRLLLLGKGGIEEERYWQPRFEEPLAGSREEVVAELRGGLERAVARQMDPAGRTGVLMSGGLDSSSLAALGVARSPGRVYAYSGTFPDHPAVDESALIAELRRELKLPGATAKARPGGLLAAALAHLEAWGTPLLGWGEFWTMPLARAAHGDGVGTMLDGTGGDELFGPFSYLLADRLRSGHPLETLRLAYELPGGGRHVPRREVARVIRSLALAGALPYGVHRPPARALARRELPEWLLPRTRRALLRSADPLAWKRLDGPRWWAFPADAVSRAVEANGVFENHARLGAAAGLELRVPLLDLDLVELALRQPPRATFDRRFSRPLLRESLAGLLPDSVRLRPEKAWFDSLIVDGLAGEPGVRALLADPAAELGAYVDLGAMRAALLDSERLRDSEPLTWMTLVWRLLTAELWLRSQGTPAAELRAGIAPTAAAVEVESVPASYFFPP